MPKERVIAAATVTLLLAIWLVALPANIWAGHSDPPPPAAGDRNRTVASPAATIVQKPPGALSYVVKPGNTLSAIAVQYGVTVADLAQANRLTSPGSLAAGEVLVIPLTAPVPGNPQVAAATHTLSWPVNGPISSPFGEREIFGHQEFHPGVDIAAAFGTPMRAPLAGRVVFAGPLGSYGLAVIIDHGDGFSTLYAHASQLMVAAGQTTAAGQIIALVGRTGVATGPHLHFETRVDGQWRDPQIYLAGK